MFSTKKILKKANDIKKMYSGSNSWFGDNNIRWPWWMLEKRNKRLLTNSKKARTVYKKKGSINSSYYEEVELYL